MDRKFIIDKEINLNDFDFLKTKVYADSLTKIIKNTEDNKVFTIGLFGSWGTGKSSIIETSRASIENENPKIKFITYDAWQYVNDSFRRMFLRKLREDLQYEETDLMKKFYENESTDISNKYQLSPTRLSFIIAGLILFLAILIFIPFNLEYKFPIYAIFTLLSLLITIISGAFYQLKISVIKPHLFAPEQFEECFKEIVSNSLKNKNIILKWVRGDKSIQNLEKLVIVIDNIDRCSNDIAYNLLTDIKTFLSSEPYSIVFVIPVDDVALGKHIINTSKGSEECDKDKEEFLRKFFNVTTRIKPYGETDMFSFAKQINEKYRLNFQPETINIASKEYAKNPRRIIQLFNNLLGELNNYDTDFAQKNETLICCVLIIREEYPDYYDSLINSPKLFIEETILEKNDDKNISGGEEVTRFIRIAHNLLGKTEIADLCMILTNSHNQFDDMSSDLKDGIQTFDTKIILNYWTNEKERIIDYITDKLDNAIKNQLIDTELVSYFDLVAEINNQYPLNKYLAKRIDEKIVSCLSIIISKTKNHENLCYYALNRNDNIKNELIDECKRSEDLDKKTYWQPLFTAILKVFNDKYASIALSSTYTKLYLSIKHEDFSAEQIEYLISDEFVQQQIAKLPVDDKKEILLDTNTEAYQKVKWLFAKKKNIAEKTYGNFFAHIIGENNDDTITRGKTIDDIAQLLKFVQPCLDLISDGKLTTFFDDNGQITKNPDSGKVVLSSLYGLIVNNRKIPHSQYKNHQNWWLNSGLFQQINFIDECIANDKYILDIIEFVISIYRISNGRTNVKEEITKFVPKYREQLNVEFIKLLKRDCTLNPILDLIIEDKNYSNENTITLLKYCLLQKGTNNTYSTEENKVKSKINDLITFAQKQKSDEVFELLELLIGQEYYKVILSNLLIEKDCDFISNLPQKFQELAIGSFREENYNDFADNFNLLSVIIQHGNNNQKEWVVKIITTKLDNNQNIEKLVDLINLMKNVPEYDPDELLSTHLKNYLRKNKDNIDDELKKQLEKQLKNLKKDIKNIAE